MENTGNFVFFSRQIEIERKIYVFLLEFSNFRSIFFFYVSFHVIFFFTKECDLMSFVLRSNTNKSLSNNWYDCLFVSTLFTTQSKKKSRFFQKNSTLREIQIFFFTRYSVLTVSAQIITPNGQVHQRKRKKKKKWTPQNCRRTQKKSSTSTENRDRDFCSAIQFKRTTKLPSTKFNVVLLQRKSRMEDGKKIDYIDPNGKTSVHELNANLDGAHSTTSICYCCCTTHWMERRRKTHTHAQTERERERTGTLIWCWIISKITFGYEPATRLYD